MTGEGRGLLTRTVLIGKVRVEGYAALAPMAGFGDAAFRSVCREEGAAFTVSEMVSAKGLIYGGSAEKTRELMTPFPNESPYAVQLFGSDPAILAEGARIACDAVKPDMIDLNMGCPVPKVVLNGEGSALMKNPRRIEEIVRAVSGAVPCPVTVKMRLGWDGSSVNAAECARAAEAAGAAFLTVHGRTRDAFYTGKADPRAIGEVVGAVTIPVAANGDVFSGRDAKRLYEETGAALVAVGRGALGNPFIFREIEAVMENREFTSPSIHDKMDLLKKQVERAVARKGEYIAMREARPHAMYAVKGLRGASRLKEEAARMETTEDLERFAEKVVSL